MRVMFQPQAKWFRPMPDLASVDERTEHDEIRDHNVGKTGTEVQKMTSSHQEHTHRSPSVLLALFAGCTLISAAAMAQRAPAPPAVVTGDAARRDVRVATDVPNISGVWVALTSNRSNSPADGGSTPFLPWARQFFETRAAAEATGKPLFDPTANCLPGGVPRIISSPYPIDIVQTPELTLILTETLHEFRMIHMDGKPKPADF